MKFLTLFLLLFINTTNAQLVDSAFSYQGELLDNGSPANGEYDIIFDAYNDEFANDPSNLVNSITKLNVMVNNGLFTIGSLDFGSVLLGNHIWYEVSIKKSSDTGDFELLSSRQKLSSVPFSFVSEFANTARLSDHAITASEASGLSPIGAVMDDILTFDGFRWLPKPAHWTQQGSLLSTTNNNQQLIIGSDMVTSSAKLTIETETNGIHTQFKSPGDIYNEYMESGIAKGYIGSVQNASNPGTTSDDFEIGTTPSNTGKLHLTTNFIPRFTVTNLGRVGVNNTSPTGQFQVDNNSFIVTSSGKVGIGTIIPTAALELSSSSSQSTEALNIRIDSQNKFTVRNDELFIGQDVKHSSTTNGLMKYMARVRCLSSGSSITSSYNAINSISVTVSDTGTTGNCTVNFPTNINNRFWQITAVSANGNHNANCHTVLNNDELLCQRTLSGVNNDGDIMVMVY